jgi:hypothetical protein
MHHTSQPPAIAGGGSVPGLEPLLSPQQIAAAWRLDSSTIRRIFQDVPGVLKLAGKGKHGTRSYQTLRIPASVAERFRQERSR